MLHKMTLREFNKWFDELPEPTRFWFFLIALMGWLVPLWLSDAVRPFNETLAIILGVFGGCWMFVTCIIALERSYHIRRRDKQ